MDRAAAEEGEKTILGTPRWQAKFCVHPRKKSERMATGGDGWVANHWRMAGEWWSRIEVTMETNGCLEGDGGIGAGRTSAWREGSCRERSGWRR